MAKIREDGRLYRSLTKGRISFFKTREGAIGRYQEYLQERNINATRGFVDALSSMVADPIVDILYKLGADAIIGRPDPNGNVYTITNRTSNAVIIVAFPEDLGLLKFQCLKHRSTSSHGLKSRLQPKPRLSPHWNPVPSPLVRFPHEAQDHLTRLSKRRLMLSVDRPAVIHAEIPIVEREAVILLETIYLHQHWLPLWKSILSVFVVCIVKEV